MGWASRDSNVWAKHARSIARKFTRSSKAVGSTSWTLTKTLPPKLKPNQPVWLKNMVYDEFSALDQGLLSHPHQSGLPAPPQAASAQATQLLPDDYVTTP